MNFGESWLLYLDSYLKNLEMLGEKVNDMMHLLIAVLEHKKAYALCLKIGDVIDDAEDKLTFYRGFFSSFLFPINFCSSY